MTHKSEIRYIDLSITLNQGQRSDMKNVCNSSISNDMSFFIEKWQNPSEDKSSRCCIGPFAPLSAVYYFIQPQSQDQTFLTIK